MECEVVKNMCGGDGEVKIKHILGEKQSTANADFMPR